MSQTFHFCVELDGIRRFSNLSTFNSHTSRKHCDDDLDAVQVEALYPTASTCVMELTLPSVHPDFGAFKAHLNVAFNQHGGFGLI